MTDNDVLFLVVCVIYLKLIVEFAASLAPAPKPRKRKGTWTQDDTKH